MQPRNAACIAAFTAAYILLIPGLHCLLFSAKASMFGMTFVDMEKSTFGAIHLLMEKGRWLAALTILVCSVIAPFLKLAVLLGCVWSMQVQGSTSPAISYAISAVRRISKWATVDAFTASILIAFFCNNWLIHVNLHQGFYCFVGYCILSTLGALLLQKPDEHKRHVSGSGLNNSTWSAPLASCVSVCCVVALSCLPLVCVECTGQLKALNLKEQLSLITMVQKLALHGSTMAACLCMILVAVLPAADIACTLTHLQHPIGEWCRDFAMLDVFALALIVVVNAAAGLHSSLVVSMLPGGWLFVSFAGMWLAYSSGLRSSRGASTLASKDKLADYL
jgi:uncharacterized paraquat-inducible protein A